MKRLLVCLALLIPLEARAAAWTQPRGSWQIITGAVLSDADRSFDAGGNASFPERFQRLLLTTDTEYGITNRLTLLVRTETALTPMYAPAMQRPPTRWTTQSKSARAIG